MENDVVVVEQKEKDEIKEEQAQEEDKKQIDKGLNEKKLSWRKLARFDSFDVETGRVSGKQGRTSHQGLSWVIILKLAFQSIGVVYGDLGTSPLYVLPGIFTNGIRHEDDVMGALSLILYTLTLITLIKYVFIVLAANDNGDGGTFALYSLICRYAKVGFTPNHQPEDKDVSNYRLEVTNRSLRRASAVKSMLEKSHVAKYTLLLLTMLGTSMVIGDGVLTPCVSVLSAVGGIKEAASDLSDNIIMWISVVILILLFQFQRFGTDKIGYSFAPILTIWFFFIGIIGIYNVFRHDPTVIKAFNPMYIVRYFMRNKMNGWISLGGVILCLTGSEALFADLGHFNIRSIQISTCTVVFPSVVLAYIGQAAYLRKHPLDAHNAFYSSVPKPVYWPMFVVAVLAAIIASQSLISAAFSIIQQSLALGCFPRVKVVHTSSLYEGQVYVPEVNHILMLICIGVTLGFKTTVKLSNAYGLAAIFVMSLTSSLLVLIMVMIWKTNIFLIIIYVLMIYLVELLYLSAALYKFIDGAYFPLAIAAVLIFIMYVWNYGYRKRYRYELENMVSMEKLKEIATDPSVRRVQGLALFYSELVHGISPIFTHYVANVSALHSIIVFVTIKSLPISKVPAEERFLFRRIEPYELTMFRCVVRYGYMDARREQESFEELLVEKLKEFVRNDLLMHRPQKSRSIKGEQSNDGNEIERISEEEVEREVQFVDNECKYGGIVHLFGESEVVASEEASCGKKFMINYAYNWLKRCVRQQNEVLTITRKRLLKVAMTYEL